MEVELVVRSVDVDLVVATASTLPEHLTAGYTIAATVHVNLPNKGQLVGYVMRKPLPKEG